MAITGKTGADAIALALHHICQILTKYQSKLLAVVDAAEAADAITSDQATQIRAFVTIATATCHAFEALAKYSGF